MANDWFTPFYQDVRTACAAAWPDVSRFFRVTQVQRLHWVNEIVKHRLTAPYGVIQVPAAMRVEGWGAANIVYKPRVTAFYIGNQTGTDYGAVLYAKMIDLQDVLLRYRWPACQVLDDEIDIDVSESNPANSILQEANLPHIAGSFSWTALAGYISQDPRV